MAIKAQQVFDIAMTLIDEVEEETGNVSVDNPAYKSKSLSILTTLQAELLPITEDIAVLASLTQDLLLPDRICLLVLPYGLSAHLLLAESDDTGMAAFYNNRYEELKRKIPTEISPIVDLYNVGMRVD
ncbi:hypothetical protein D0469_06975 [Peribacillus saganii]|uniref:Uncharacterized protein n=1 Tax=Peribacillus saganii TaxID=2303992 RepID=A0A372LQL0_9BACI|nr:hypothetical protein [Peribacillus saganii]RFU70336.1 hypothetical protein D0469_06975 [Peribacillus saganii]